MLSLSARPNLRKQVWALSYPIILSNLFIPLPGIVDTIVLGRLGDESFLGGVALSTVIYSFLYWGVAFLRKGTTGLGAQANGANDQQELWSVFFRAILLAIIISVLLLTLKGFIADFAFWCFEASSQVEAHAYVYYDIRIWGAPASFLNFVIIGWLLAVKDSKRPMILQIIINCLNVVLDLVFVLYLDMTVDGVALATVIAEYVGLAIGILFILSYRHKWPSKGIDLARIVDSQKLKRLLVVNRELLVRSVLLMFAFAYQTSEAAKVSDSFLAAMVILGHLFHICSFGLDGFAHACESLVGNAIGARDRHKFSMVVTASFEMGLIVALLMAAAYFIGGDLWISIFTNISDLQLLTKEYLLWMVAMPILGMWCFIFD
ncbi:MAG: MATE family efflux transporter, partial [Alphaproteobacteria bacterium]|nr:MATE family efflux transporter [Alphaproteobacteria bacterium]